MCYMVIHFIYALLKSDFLAGGNCSVSQLSTKSTLGRNARQRGKTITNKNNSQAVDVASPPVTKSK